MIDVASEIHKAKTFPLIFDDVSLYESEEHEMTQKDIQRIITIATTFSGYDEESKGQFHRLARKYLKELANIMELAPGDFEIRSNRAGIACLGEVTLHSNNLYVQLGGSFANQTFYYRAVRGMKDYTGGRNAFAPYTALLDQAGLAEKFTDYLDSHRYEWA